MHLWCSCRCYFGWLFNRSVASLKCVLKGFWFAHSCNIGTTCRMHCICDMWNVKLEWYKATRRGYKCLSAVSPRQITCHNPSRKKKKKKDLFQIKCPWAERNECDAARFCIFVTITPNSKLILCRQRAMVSRWLPYLRGTVSTAAHASLDKGLSLWSSNDTLSPSQEPPPISLQPLLSFSSAFFFSSIHLALLSCPSSLY